MSRKIDHIVYCVHELDKAIEYIEAKLGVKATIGGKHMTQGTKNALINLGNECYLEILAIDENNTSIKGDRWMGIDLLKSNKITRWALKANDITQDSQSLQAYNPEMGHVTGGSRKMTNGNTLTWQIAMPLSNPEIDLAPFITDWSESETHPTDSLNHPCQLLELRLKHPNPTKLQNLFSELNIDLQIDKSDFISIEAIIKCPNGIVQL